MSEDKRVTHPTHPEVCLDAEQMSDIDAGRLYDAAVRLQNGDESAFNDIYAETLQAFSDAVKGECQDDPVYQDVLQTAYIRIERELSHPAAAEDTENEVREEIPAAAGNLSAAEEAGASENSDAASEEVKAAENPAAAEEAEYPAGAGRPELSGMDPEGLVKWMVSVLQEVLNRTLDQKEREVPEDLEEFLKIGKSIISSKDIKDFEKKKKAEEDRKEEEEIMNLH